MDKVKLFFEMFSELPKWFTNLWILVVASIYGIKGTQIFKGGMNKDEKIMSGYLVKKALGKGKVSPTIKSVKPSPTVMKKGVKASVPTISSVKYIKRINLTDASEEQIETGKKLMKEGQKER